MIDYKLLEKQLMAISKENEHFITILSNASALLYSSIDQLNWVGFYLLDNNYLILGPFQGKVACSKIEIGKGVCGTAVKENKIQVVDDVHKIDNHIACDTDSQSEIVLPLYNKDKKIIGVLDIDSPIICRFNKEDVIGLTSIAELLSSLLSSFSEIRI